MPGRVILDFNTLFVSKSYTVDEVCDVIVYNERSND